MAVVTQGCQCLIEILLAHPLLDEVPDVTLVDELVCLRDLSHDFKNEVLCVSIVSLEARIGGCEIVVVTRHACCTDASNASRATLTHEC